MSDSPGDVTALLRQASAGDQAALERLLPLVYDELRRLAADHLGRERPDHTLQPTALVHEAWIRLVDQTRTSWESRGQFLAVAATSMRRILVDHARGRARIKRAAAGERVALEEDAAVAAERGVDLVAIDEALRKLGEDDSRKVRVIELRFFAGMTIEETAAALSIAPATVKRDWEFARLWLLRELSGEGGGDA